MTDTLMVDRQLVKTLQGRVADEMTRAKQLREARGERELSESDERQLAFSVITQAVQRHLASVLAAGGELPGGRRVRPETDRGGRRRDVRGRRISGPDHRPADRERRHQRLRRGFHHLRRRSGEGAGPADRRDGRRADPDRAEPGVPGVAEPAAVQPGEPGAGPAVAGRVPVVGGDVGAAERPVVSIRRSRYPQMFLSTLVDLGTIDDQLACFLQAAVTARMNLVIGGATDAGKTTLLRALAQRDRAGGAADHRGAVPGVGVAAAPGAAPGRGGAGGGAARRGRQRRPDHPGPGAPHPQTQPGQMLSSAR